MLTIRDLAGNEEILADYKNMTRKRRVNGEHSLSFLLFKTERNAHSFDMVEDETIILYDGHEYRVKQIEQRLVGHAPVKQVHADLTFFDIIDVYQYGKLVDGNKTISSALQHALKDTGYTFSVVDTFASQYFENFGEDNALSLLKTILERYQAEYTLVGKDVRIYKQIGAETDFQFRYRHNIKTFAKTVKTDGLSTFIRGYGKENEDGTYAAATTYTSPMADIYGIRHAKPIRDDRFTDNASLLDYIKSQIQDTPEVSITIDFADMRKAGYPYDVPGFGDIVYLIYEPLSVDMTTRILEIIDYPETDKSPQVTLANFREQFADVVFRHTKNELEKIYDPNSGKIRYNVLDDAVRVATEALKSAQTELEFNNGIIAREKEDPNRLVLFNSAGLGISTDGGSTFNTAMTADGIVADVLTGGQINANNVSIYGGSTKNYTTISGSYWESRGNFSRTWRGVTKTHDIIIKSENGYLRARNDSENRSLYFTDYGISTQVDGVNASGTLEFFSTVNSALGRGVTLTSEGVTTIEANGGALFLTSSTTINSNAAIYTPSIVTTSTNAYIGADGEVRMVNKGTADTTVSSEVIYRNLRAAILYGTGFNTTSTNAYIGADGELRVVNKGFVDGSSGTTVYRDIRASVIRGIALDLDGTTAAEHMYVRPSATGALRVTSRGTTDSYRPIEASEFNAASSVFYKKNIEDYTGDATELIGGTPVRLYHLNEDIDTIDFKRVGLLVQEAPREIINMKTGDSIDLYAMASVLWKAVQELSADNEALNQRITALEGGTKV
ncbi:MAG: phage tail protein [Bacillota bacterium]